MDLAKTSVVSECNLWTSNRRKGPSALDVNFHLFEVMWMMVISDVCSGVGLGVAFSFRRFD